MFRATACSYFLPVPVRAATSGSTARAARRYTAQVRRTLWRAWYPPPLLALPRWLCSVWDYPKPFLDFALGFRVSRESTSASMESTSASRDFPGNPGKSLEIHGNPWKCWKSRSFQWNILFGDRRVYFGIFGKVPGIRSESCPNPSAEGPCLFFSAKGREVEGRILAGDATLRPPRVRAGVD